MPKRLESTTTGRRVMHASLVVATLALGAAALGAPAAGADTGWSRVPASGLAGGTVQVASSSSTLCQWTQPAGTGAPAAATPTAPDPAAPAASPPEGTGTTGNADAAPTARDVTYDGTDVLVRLSRDGVDIPLGRLPVLPGGAWSGSLTVPAVDVAPPGEYQIFAKCVIDRPELDGIRTYDFDPLGFTVVEAPPPTTVEAPPVLVPPATAENPVEVQGAQITRPTSSAAAPTAANATPTLPNTGDSTLGIALAGIGSLLVGGAALWWGARHARRHPTGVLD